MRNLPLRTLADWTPEAGDVDDWRARCAAAGWVPGHPWGGTPVTIDGHQLTQWAMIQAEPARPRRTVTAPDDWLTIAAAGKRLGVAPGVVTTWIRVGRLRGRRQQDRWRVDPVSVDEEMQRLSRAS